MMCRILSSLTLRSSALAVGVALLLATPSSAEKITADASPDQPAKATTAKPKKVVHSKLRAKKRAPITNPKFDPKAAHVPLFDGIQKGTLNVRMVAQDQFGGNLYVENRSNQPLTVEMAPFVGVQVLRQFGAGGGAMGGRGGAGGMGAQSMGGGMGMGGMGGGGMGGMGGGMGGGMFSVPPERVVKVPYHSVCLEHGKNDPDATVHYKLIPVNQYTDNDQLSALVTLIAAHTIDPQVAQAAAWHLSSKLSWEELAAKRSTEPGAFDYPYFSQEALLQAQELVAEARGFAAEKALHPEKKAAPKTDADNGDHVIRGR